MDYIDLMNGKQIYDLDTGSPVTFLNDLQEVFINNLERGVYCDGMMVVDTRTSMVGDIAQLYCKLVKGAGKNRCMNMLDFYNYFGAFEEDNTRFYIAVDELIRDRSARKGN